MTERWTGDWEILTMLRYKPRPEWEIQENINPMYPLHEVVEFPRTYKSSDGAARASVSGEINETGRNQARG